jgi:pSer/pThr/pTyr-binding forkhead associated (FHA) protein
VSSEHAAIVTILNDSFLEDLDSTNGLAVNGTPTKKHFLQNNDLIEIGKYKLKYLNDQPTQTSAADFEKTMVLRAPVKMSPGEATAKSPLDVTVTRKAEATSQFNVTNSGMAAADVTGGQPPAALVQILNGPNAGKELELVKNLTTLGKPGVQVAVLARRPHGYFITHVEGGSFPTVNGSSIGEQPHQLRDHDLIELAGVKMEFYFKT